MKIKSTLLIAFCLLLFACPPNSKNNNIQTAVLTKTNYAYEGDLYRFALTVETEALKKQIKTWEEQGEEEKGDIENANIRIEKIRELLLDNPAGIGFGFPPMPPLPPIPCYCFDLYEDLRYVVGNNKKLFAISATLINEDKKEVFTTDNSNPLITDGLDGEFSAYKFLSSKDGFTGNGTLKITRFYSKEDFESYSIPVRVNELP